MKRRTFDMLLCVISATAALTGLALIITCICCPGTRNWTLPLGLAASIIANAVNIWRTNRKNNEPAG